MSKTIRQQIDQTQLMGRNLTFLFQTDDDI